MTTVIILNTSLGLPALAEPPRLRVASGQVRVSGAGDGVADALVSDGHTFVRTDAEGRFELTLHAAARWVMLVNPSGFKPTQSLFHRLDITSDAAEVRADFQLERLTASPEAPFSFAYLSDSHVGSHYRADWTRRAFIDAINRSWPAPAFVIESGDVSLDTVERLEIASVPSTAYQVPYFPAIGNHDRPRAGSFRGATFERLFAPIYYAFTYRNYLFVTLPWADEVDLSLAWTQALLQELGEGYHLIVSVHHWDGIRRQFEPFQELLRAASTRAVLMGHYHLNQVYEEAGLPVYTTTSGSPYTRDLSRPAFNVVTAHPDGRLEVEQREVEHHQATALVLPESGRPLERGASQPLLVRAYDTAVPVARVDVTVYEGSIHGERLAQLSLAPKSSRLWGVELPVGKGWPASVYLVVEIEDRQGHRWAPLTGWYALAAAGDPPQPQAGVGVERPAPVRIAWVYGTPGGFGFSAPVVRDQTVYLGIEHFTEPDRLNPVLVALDAVTGTPRWTFHDRGRSVRSTPWVGEDVLVAQASDGRVIALERESGQLQWTNDAMISHGTNARAFFRSSPAGLGTAAVVVGSGSSYMQLGLADGTLGWAHRPGEGDRGWAPPSPVVAGDRLLLSVHNTLQAVAVASGAVLWEKRFPAALGSGPVVAGEVLGLVVRAEGRREPFQVLGLSPESGEVLWQTPLEHLGKGFCQPVAVGGDLLVVDMHHLVAIESATGWPRWRADFSACLSPRDHLISRELMSAAHFDRGRFGFVTGMPAVAGSTLYLVTRTGTLIAFDLAADSQTPRLLWSYALNTPVDAGPVVVGNTLYIADRHGALYALTLGDS